MSKYVLQRVGHKGEDNSLTRQVWLAPSILAADFAKLGEEVHAVLDAGADMIHFDVMDNHFVPNLTIGPMVCRSLRQAGVAAPIDVHLMVDPVDAMIELFAQAGASMITFHPEASADCQASLDLIKAKGCQAGLALNPGQSCQALAPYIDSLDLVLLMSVQPGFGGQALLPGIFDMVPEVRAMLDQAGSRARLSVDGGVTLANAGRLVSLGADVIVAGSAIFSASDYHERCAAFRAVWA
jgi:ribulose-phosphate 3-epimerase